MRHLAMLLCTIVLLACGAGSALAHLSIVRQGRDGAGVLESSDRTGEAVSCGDFDGDGFDDLAIGAPGETVGSLASAGAVVVYYGSQFGLTHLRAFELTAASVGATAQAGAEFGAALAAGDFDGDGDDELAVAAPGENVGASSQSGRVYVCFREHRPACRRSPVRSSPRAPSGWTKAETAMADASSPRSWAAGRGRISSWESLEKMGHVGRSPFLMDPRAVSPSSDRRSSAPRTWV